MSGRKSDYVLVPSKAHRALVARETGIPALNSDDWGRIEACLRGYADEIVALPESKRHPRAEQTIRRTLDKVERINQTGDYTPQFGG
ncbi:hypothetical protein [Microbacterium sp. zg-YB36]|uniref:hypothetical protein n=1 Tax=Microbacterium sp. zg-YB36 TaxID=2969407 RepID=UPI00214CA609|nr:hypothetical protein [Microbacterium sp. zg-YB36]MDL5351128.1 hypothetical protein [Microbacterium sp. zg-YB36]